VPSLRVQSRGARLRTEPSLRMQIVIGLATLKVTTVSVFGLQSLGEEAARIKPLPLSAQAYRKPCG
jgi:hypothetical protein